MSLRRSSKRHSHRLSLLSRTSDRRRSEHQLDDRTSILSGSTFLPRNNRLSFNKVQVSRRQHNDDSSSDESDDRPSPLLAVTSKAWNLYRVSPLYGYANNATSLKKYGRLLRNYLQSQRIDVKKDIRYEVKFTVLHGLKWTAHDTDALQIEVLTLTEGKKPAVIYLGILLSWGGSKEMVSEHFIHLPLLLCISSFRSACSVHGILSKMFDCIIQPLEISQDDLMWLSVIANTKTERHDAGKRKAEFHYKSPEVPAGSMAIHLPYKSVHDLWSKIHTTNDQQIVDKEVYNFHQILGDQLFVLHKIKHSQLQLWQFVLPNMSMVLSGRFRVRTIEVAEYVLSYLYSLSLIIEGPSPTLSIKPH